MNGKERVHAALSRQPTDRVPVFMWFHPEMAVHFADVLEIPASSLPEVMGDDVRQAWVANNYAMEGITHENDGEGHIDAWGIEWVKRGPFNQVERAPLEDAGPDEARAYEFPYDAIDDLMKNMDPVVAEKERFFIGCDVSPCAFEMLCRIRGMENAILDLASEPTFAGDMMDKCVAFARALAERACDTLPLDWLWTGDDVGGQQGMIMSPTTWRELIKPRLATVTEVGTSRGLPVAYHSCGAIRPIIPDLIEIGVTVLNPVQSTCPGMDPAELKSEFGADLTFMGGVDTQYLLPNGTADEVRKATAELLEIMTDGGGYILAASHTIPPETPDENVFALYETAGISREEIMDRAADVRGRA